VACQRVSAQSGSLAQRAFPGVITTCRPCPGPGGGVRTAACPCVCATSGCTASVALAEPNLQEFAPVEPRGIDRWFGGMSRYRQDQDAARARFETATAAFLGAQAKRAQSLAAAQAEHRRQVEAAQAKAAAHNRDTPCSSRPRRTATAPRRLPGPLSFMASRVLVDLEVRTLHRAHLAFRACVAGLPYPAAVSAPRSHDPTHIHAGSTTILNCCRPCWTRLPIRLDPPTTVRNQGRAVP
jgi:hypothetical protein